MGAVNERDVIAAIGEQLGVPFVDLRRDSPDADVVSLLPEQTARDLTAIPLRREEEGVIVAVADPTGDVANKLKTAMKTTVVVHIAPAADIERAINNSYRALDSVGRLVDAFAAAESSRRGTVTHADVMPDDAPVVRIVNMLINQAVRDRTSDIHIEPQDEAVRVRYRIDGALADAVSLPEALGPAIISRIKIMAGLNIVERRRAQDGQINVELDGRTLDIRVNTMPTIWGEKAVMRILDRKRTLHNLDDLGMPNDVHKVYAKMVRSPYGMLVCAGPTGSGKTTTLYATLNEINDPKANITTIEDPVEYVFPSINQIQINEQAGMTFAGGLRHPAPGPDIILVGEIRDVETARIAVQSALTGHFVLSTIHATDSASALHRFLDMGIERFLVASSVSMIVSQRLLRRICPHCRVTRPLSVDEQAFFDAYAERSFRTQFWYGEGCNFCANTGYLDRVGVYEVMEVTDDIRQHHRRQRAARRVEENGHFPRNVDPARRRSKAGQSGRDDRRRSHAHRLYRLKFSQRPAGAKRGVAGMPAFRYSGGWRRRKKTRAPPKGHVYSRRRVDAGRPRSRSPQRPRARNALKFEITAVKANRRRHALLAPAVGVHQSRRAHRRRDGDAPSGDEGQGPQGCPVRHGRGHSPRRQPCQCCGAAHDGLPAVLCERAQIGRDDRQARHGPRPVVTSISA